MKKTSLLHLLPQNYLSLGWGSWKQLLVSLSYRSYIPNLFKIGPVILEKKILMQDGWRTTHDGRRQNTTYSKRSPEWLTWPKIKAFLKTLETCARRQLPLDARRIKIKMLNLFHYTIKLKLHVILCKMLKNLLHWHTCLNQSRKDRVAVR